MMPSKRFIIGVAICFCVVYVAFMHLETSFKYYNSTQDIAIDPNSVPASVRHDATVPYPYQSPTIARENSFSEFPSPKKVAVILNCEGRSGSTWLSSFFWKNPHVFYVYEPLFPSTRNDNAMKKATLSKEMGQIFQLSDTYQCNIDYSKDETFFPMVLGRYPMYQPELKHCETSNTCPQSLTSFCQSRSHVVQKVIRVHNISDYQLLREKVGMPLKIIHLVRDPRPHIISREKVFSYMLNEGEGGYNLLTAEQKSEQRRLLCMRELENLKIGDSGLFDSNTYIRLSHEEMSLDPIKWAKKLYEFVGLDFTESTEAYINEITHGSDLVHGGKDPDGRYAGFSVYRDTLTILYKWKKSSARHIHDIETECQELLSYMGYTNIYDDGLNKINDNPWPSIVADPS